MRKLKDIRRASNLHMTKTALRYLLAKLLWCCCSSTIYIYFLNIITCCLNFACFAFESWWQFTSWGNFFSFAQSRNNSLLICAPHIIKYIVFLTVLILINKNKNVTWFDLSQGHNIHTSNMEWKKKVKIKYYVCFIQKVATKQLFWILIPLRAAVGG